MKNQHRSCLLSRKRTNKKYEKPCENCHTTVRHHAFRSDSTSCSTESRSVGIALDRIDPEILISRKARVEACSLARRAARVGGSGKKDPSQGQSARGQKK